MFPLAHAGQSLGLFVGLARSPDFFDHDNLTMLAEVARIVAASMYFTRLHDSVRAEHRRAELLQEFGFRCALATTPEDVCDAVLTVGGPVVGARTVGITLVTRRRERLSAHSRDIVLDEYRDFETPLSSTALLAQAIGRGEMVSAASREEIDRHFPGSAVANAAFVKSACAIPLTLGRRVVGSVGFAFESEGPISADQARTVQLVADQSAAALERVRLDEQRRAAIAQFQDSLVPAILPEVGHCDLAAHYRPAPEGLDLGGDWYDAFARPDGSVCLIVGDAAGKGVAAATTVGALRHIVRYFAFSCDDPGTALDATNDAFLLGMDLAPNIATVCLAIARADGSVQISSAGHLPPLRVGSTSAALLTGCVDPPIGLRGSARRSYTAHLAPGDTIVLYTDGLIERRREPLDLSLERLVDTGLALRGLSTQTSELVERLMKQLAHDAMDDVALLAATRVGSR